MNVLEKILEEIEVIRDIMKSPINMDCFEEGCKYSDCTVCVCENIMDIIRSHMDENKLITDKTDKSECNNDDVLSYIKKRFLEVV